MARLAAAGVVTWMGFVCLPTCPSGAPTIKRAACVPDPKRRDCREGRHTEAIQVTGVGLARLSWKVSGLPGPCHAAGTVTTAVPLADTMSIDPPWPITS
jgi:hypothetical protein